VDVGMAYGTTCLFGDPNRRISRIRSGVRLTCSFGSACRVSICGSVLVSNCSMSTQGQPNGYAYKRPRALPKATFTQGHIHKYSPPPRSSKTLPLPNLLLLPSTFLGKHPTPQTS
jgi:hypothetical protein